jgi:serine phosphatase RsbU (regulator of sigma subunit)
MNVLLSSVRRDAVRLVVALFGLVLAQVLLVAYGDTIQMPVALLLLPVLGLALVAEGPATAVVAVAAIGLGWFDVQTSIGFEPAFLQFRVAILVLGTVLAVALATARSSRELALGRQAQRLDMALARAETDAVVQAMVDRLPELTQVEDVRTTARLACSLARELFGADIVSYWHLEGDTAVLWGRTQPSEELPLGVRLPATQVRMDGGGEQLSRTKWVRQDTLTDRAQPLADRMRHFGCFAATSTPLILAGQTLGYLNMGWRDEHEQPNPFWLDALDRFADQVAVAKSVIHRRDAQNRAQNLAERFQAEMLPVLPEGGPVVVRSMYRPGTAHMLLGGDFLDARVDAEGRVCFLLGDVAGHGPEQAALGVRVRGAWQGLSSVDTLGVEDWAMALDRVVRNATDAMHQPVLVTMVTGWIDPVSQLLTYVSAGHPPPFLFSPDPTSGPLGDLPLGICEHSKFAVHFVDLQDTDAVLLVTDGLYEGHTHPQGAQRFDLDTFIDLVRHRGVEDLDGPNYLNDLADEMERHNGAALADDAAALLFRLPSRSDP